MVLRPLVWSAVIGVATMICGNERALAENQSVIGNWQVTKETNYPSSCEVPQVELFACQLKSRRLVSFCFDNQSRQFQFRLSKTKGTPDVVPLSDVHQIIWLASAGASTIIRGQTLHAPLTLYLDTNTADVGEGAGSALQFSGQPADFCIDSSIRTPVNRIESLGSKTELIDIWYLLSLDLTKPFIFDTGSRKKVAREESDLRMSWPNKTSN